MNKELPLLQDNAIALLKKLIATPSFSKEEQNTADILEQFLSRHSVKTYAWLNNIWAKNKYFDSNKRFIVSLYKLTDIQLLNTVLLI